MEDKPIFAFVLMPFAPKFGDVYELGIKEASSSVGITANRLDEQIFVEGMMERIYRQIEAADIIIADMSDQNPNVFYEVGYAHAKDKLCILLTHDTKDIPFDLKGSISLLRQELIKNLDWAKTEIENARRSQLRVVFKPRNTSLSSAKYSASAHITFQIDLFNDSNRPSTEITAIYFYTGNLWLIEQDGKECPKTDSDVLGFSHRYFLKSPVTRLHAKSWAQLQISTRRVIALAYRGDEIRDSYTVTGNVLLRFTTSDGVFDYREYINVEVEDIPF
jgi:hypothetical protein